MAKRTKEEIQKEVKEASAKRKQEYFDAQAEAKTKAAAGMKEVPVSDAYIYTNVWRQDAGGSGGQFNLIKTANPYYDVTTNKIFDPATNTWKNATVSRISSNIAFPNGLPSVPGKTVTSVTRNPDGSYTIRYSDGTTSKATPETTTTSTSTSTVDGNKVDNNNKVKKEINRVINADGSTTINYDDGTSVVIPVEKDDDGSNNKTSSNLDTNTETLIKSLQAQIAALTASTQQSKVDQAAIDAAAKKEKTENAITSLTARFSQYGLQSLVPKLRELAISGASEATIALQLQDTPEYQLRFKANQDRLKKGLAVLDPGDYIGLEDKYRQILRAYGLTQFDNDNYVSQFIANDVSTAELSSRVQTAVQRVQNADPAVLATLNRYYGIGSRDLVGYVLDPEQQFQKIERQVAAAEIGAAAGLQGIQPGVAVSEQLAAQGISQAEAQKGYSTIADILPGAEKLSQIYGTSLEGYGLAEAEQEVFNSLASAQRKRRKLVEREVSAFSGSSGLSKASLTQQVGGTF